MPTPALWTLQPSESQAVAVKERQSWRKCGPAMESRESSLVWAVQSRSVVAIGTVDHPAECRRAAGDPHLGVWACGDGSDIGEAQRHARHGEVRAASCVTLLTAGAVWACQGSPERSCMQAIQGPGNC